MDHEHGNTIRSGEDSAPDSNRTDRNQASGEPVVVAEQPACPVDSGTDDSGNGWSQPGPRGYEEDGWNHAGAMNQPGAMNQGRDQDDGQPGHEPEYRTAPPIQDRPKTSVAGREVLAGRRANMKTAMKTNIRAGISTMAGIIIRPSTRPAIRTRPAAGINIRSSLKKRMGWQSPPWSWESCPLSHAAAAGLHLCWESWASYLPSCPGARTACAARPRRD